MPSVSSSQGDAAVTSTDHGHSTWRFRAPNISLPDWALGFFSPRGWRHVFLIPLDLLVLLFLSQTMLPAWAVALLAIVNFGTWWCYYRIPQFLRTVAGPEGQGILIPGHIVEYFAQFINSCGIHHRAHYGLMLAMMAGFHAAMTGRMWGGDFGQDAALTLAWVSYAGLLTFDTVMYMISLRTLQELRDWQFAYIASRGFVKISVTPARNAGEETRRN